MLFNCSFFNLNETKCDGCGEFFKFQSVLQRLIYGGGVLLLESFSINSKEIFFINNFIANPLL